MLLQRVITAVVLLALLLPTLFVASPWPFAALTLVLIGAAGWEWGRLNAASATTSLLMGVLLALLCGAAWWAGAVRVGASPMWWVALGVWVLGGALALRAGPQGWPQLPRAVRWPLGLLLLVTAWLAMASAKVVGLNFLLSIFCLVWVADIAAYTGGRLLGKRKLAPAISPGKSWEGVWSGMLGVAVLAAAWIWLDKAHALGSVSLFTLLLQRLEWWGLLIALVFLSSMSVLGDLLESLVKRAAGVKDSSALLPGHGGVLDRVDALLPVFPIAMALCTL
jgi:phosphatidate cytidylyltransferase